MLDSHTATNDAPALQERELQFQAGDNTLAGRLYLPAGTPVAAVVLNGATGAPQSFYRHFARWLAAARGMACLTYDYSDFGASAQRHPRQARATQSQWGLTDQPAARAEMRRQLPDVPLWVIGHSIGGMLMPLQEGTADVDRMIVVAGGLVHHHDHPWPYRFLAYSFWFGHVPLAVRLAGYLPGRAVGFGADLPASLYRQWKAWCSRPGSDLDERGDTMPLPRWAAGGGAVDLVALTDDQMIPPKCVWRLAGLYGDVPQSRILLDPADFGLKKVGHIAAFAPRNAALWPALVPEDLAALGRQARG
jgi:predicted alpha/beta hydrolase